MHYCKWCRMDYMGSVRVWFRPGLSVPPFAALRASWQKKGLQRRRTMGERRSRRIRGDGKRRVVMMLGQCRGRSAQFSKCTNGTRELRWEEEVYISEGFGSVFIRNSAGHTRPSSISVQQYKGKAIFILRHTTSREKYSSSSSPFSSFFLPPHPSVYPFIHRSIFSYFILLSIRLVLRRPLHSIFPGVSFRFSTPLLLPFLCPIISLNSLSRYCATAATHTRTHTHSDWLKGRHIVSGMDTVHISAKPILIASISTLYEMRSIS